MKQRVRPILIKLMSATVLALLYNIAAGIITSVTRDWLTLELSGLYIDIAFFLILIYLIEYLRRMFPAYRNSLGPVGVLVQRMFILLIPILILVRLSIQAKVWLGSWYTFISFGTIASYQAIAFFVFLIYVGLDMGYELLDKWRSSEAEKEKLHRLHTQAQLENLKAQVNPHFLFNSLNTLSSLIVEDEARARQFVRQLSSVYRYILENREKDMVTLDNEIKLFDSYIYLCETRFEDNLKVETQWPDRPTEWRIPPMTLQILVENAIKHNAISTKKPLKLWVETKGNQLIVGNSDQPRRQLESGTGFGLSNIRERFAQLSNQKIQIDKVEGNFVVTLPLIKA
ncbi:sensor histidine kinase [Phaeocystidibacter luteus]|uniref:Signal transduction histidine kinase internal region domain-containing protein n=1 Tax=Phaeocystidibacter luteus TaxID=911197 RepID=A0A6N6RE43_9FLAO|nr:histidine kinase [Phaeocystidibacter luteus]KAB2808054.1 hypothetical protein F8C67_10810 [Phaeocystidibacter luteus]